MDEDGDRRDTCPTRLIACAAHPLRKCFPQHLASVPLPPVRRRSDSGMQHLLQGLQKIRRMEWFGQEGLHQFGRQMAHAGL